VARCSFFWQVMQVSPPPLSDLCPSYIPYRTPGYAGMPPLTRVPIHTLQGNVPNSCGRWCEKMAWAAAPCGRRGWLPL